MKKISQLVIAILLITTAGYAQGPLFTIENGTECSYTFNVSGGNNNQCIQAAISHSTFLGPGQGVSIYPYNTPTQWLGTTSNMTFPLNNFIWTHLTIISNPLSNVNWTGNSLGPNNNWVSISAPCFPNPNLGPIGRFKVYGATQNCGIVHVEWTQHANGNVFVYLHN